MLGRFKYLRIMRSIPLEQSAVWDLMYVAAFFLGGLGFAVGPFLVVILLAPRSTRNTRDKTTQLIECGMDPIGDAWVKFGAVYYLYALMFLAFAVDILFFFPAALVYTKITAISNIAAFVEILLFAGILSLVIVYAWKKGVFRWERKTYNLQ